MKQKFFLSIVFLLFILFAKGQSNFEFKAGINYSTIGNYIVYATTIVNPTDIYSQGYFLGAFYVTKLDKATVLDFGLDFAKKAFNDNLQYNYPASNPGALAPNGNPIIYRSNNVLISFYSIELPILIKYLSKNRKFGIGAGLVPILSWANAKGIVTEDSSYSSNITGSISGINTFEIDAKASINYFIYKYFGLETSFQISLSNVFSTPSATSWNFYPLNYQNGTFYIFSLGAVYRMGNK